MRKLLLPFLLSETAATNYCFPFIINMYMYIKCS